MPAKVALLLGAGLQVGLATIKRFSKSGYQVAAIAQDPRPEVEAAATFTLAANFEDAATLDHIFEEVTRRLGAPSVVIYNASSFNPFRTEDPLSVSPTTFASDLKANTDSLDAAVQHSVKAFSSLPSAPGTPKPTFIYTGNILNRIGAIPWLGHGTGKTGSMNVIKTASTAYEGKYRFFHADQRTDDGAPVMGSLDAEAHADVFLELAEGKEWGWEVHFVKGKGCV